MLKDRRVALVVILAATALGLAFVFLAKDLVIIVGIIALLVVLGGIVPFLSGFVVQLVIRGRELSPLLGAVTALVVSLPSVLSGQGIVVKSAGPPVIGWVATFLFALWFVDLGASSARSLRARRATRGHRSSAEA